MSNAPEGEDHFFVVPKVSNNAPSSSELTSMTLAEARDATARKISSAN